MRIRNKEIRQRRHRKEQRVKQLVAEAKAAAKGGKTRAPKPAAAKLGTGPAPKKKTTTTRAKKIEGDATPKKRTTKKTEAETPAEPSGE